MNVFIATSNHTYVNIIQDALGNDDYNYHLINDTQILADNFANNNITKSDLLFLDYDFYHQVTNINKDDMILFPRILICDTVENIDLIKAMELDTALILPLLTVSHEEIRVQIKLLIHNFQKIHRIQQYAYVDSLTKISNRHLFLYNLDKLFTQYKDENKSFCLGVIDLDDFKFVNDTFGHLKGDELLTTVAAIMQKNCRKTDILARLGGEEFAILFVDTDIEQSYAILERIRLCVEQSDEIDDLIKITISAGLTKICMEHVNYESLIHDADLLLYKAKDLGKNQICY